MVVPPGPRGLRLIGNIEAYEEDRLQFLTNCARDYGDIVAVSENIYSVNRPDLIEQILGNTDHAFVVSQNLFRREVADAFQNEVVGIRGLMVRGLHRSAVLAFVPRMVCLTEQATRGWSPGQQVDLQADMELLTARLSAFYCFEVDGLNVPRLARNLLDALVPISSSPFIFPSWFPKPTVIHARRAFRDLEREIRRIITVRRQESGSRSDLLSSLMKPGRDDVPPTEAEIVQTVLPILVASLRVPAAAISWTCWLLARHPSSEELVRSEVGRVVGNRRLEPPDIDRLEYLHAVVKEALRLYPPTWLFDRKVIKDTLLDGYPLRRGQRLVFSPFVVHRDPRYYGDAESFKPERWLDDQWTKTLPKYAYFPFGGGPRACVGAGLATTEIITVLATMLRVVRLRLPDETRIVPDSRNTLVPKGLSLSVGTT